MQRICNECHEEKDLEKSFYKCNGYAGGYRPKCKDCMRKYNNGSWAKYTKAWKSKNPCKSLLSNVRSRARANSIPFNLDIDWVTEKYELTHCEVTGLPFSDQFGPFCRSIDRVIPEIGYIKENCIMTVLIYNKAKGQWAFDDVMRMARALIDNANSKDDTAL